MSRIIYFMRSACQCLHQAQAGITPSSSALSFSPCTNSPHPELCFSMILFDSVVEVTVPEDVGTSLNKDNFRDSSQAALISIAGPCNQPVSSFLQLTIRAELFMLVKMQSLKSVHLGSRKLDHCQDRVLVCSSPSMERLTTIGVMEHKFTLPFRGIKWVIYGVGAAQMQRPAWESLMF
ncbi:hypothetical protein V8D89_016294 [Ganoderma adspersum]